MLIGNQNFFATNSTYLWCFMHAGCNDNEFHCISSRMCIPDAKVCDGKNDCPQEEDETLNRCSKMAFFILLYYGSSLLFHKTN